MTKTMKKMGAVLLMLLVMFAGCSKDKNVELANQVKDNIAVLNDLQTGQVSLESVSAYYADIKTKWEEILAANPPKEYETGINAQLEIATFLADVLTQTTETPIEIVYIGSVTEADSKNVTGIFIYNFGDDVASLAKITDTIIEDANSFTVASETGEFFHKYENYFISCEYGLIENYETLFVNIDAQLKQVNQ